MAGKKSKVEFTGSQGDSLAGLLEIPSEEPKAWALFAHCFTCGKDIAAASRISRALVARGFAVMRFDFTGLGNSDGDFANTNFSSNVEDLVSASNWLGKHHKAPALLIGHSLGGTAVLKAAHSLPDARGVVTIGSPATAHHVAKQFACDLDAINRDGEATVTLAGRNFQIKKQFVDDIQNNSDTHIRDIRKPLLIMHSPVDTVVSINQAQELYSEALHPKSFVSLDDADHLLTRAADAEYAAETITAWASRFVAAPATEKPIRAAKGRVIVSERNHKFAQSVFSDTHHWIADEPKQVGGEDLGPDPYEHLLASLGTCTSMTVRLYAARKKWPLEHVQVELEHTRDHGADCAACDESNPQIDTIVRRISFAGDLDDSQRKRLLEIADRCPVHKTLSGKLVVETAMIEAAATK